MRRVLLIALASVTVLWLASSPAFGALWLRITVDPPHPTSGEAARVSVLTGYLTRQGCANDRDAIFVPHPREEWHSSDASVLELRMVALGPEGQRIDVALAPRESDTSYWDGAVRFPSAGEWVLRITAPSWPATAEECAGARRTLTVRSAGDVAAAIALVVVMAVLAAGFALTVRVRLSSPVPSRPG